MVRHQAETAGIVALSGYYFWTVRPDVLLVGLAALPGVGDVLRYTVSPLLNWLMMPLVKRGLFSPGPVPARFDAEFSTGMAVRPSQIRATAEDGALMIPGALSLRGDYKTLRLPVVIMAGRGQGRVRAPGRAAPGGNQRQRAPHRPGCGPHDSPPGHATGGQRRNRRDRVVVGHEHSRASEPGGRSADIRGRVNRLVRQGSIMGLDGGRSPTLRATDPLQRAGQRPTVGARTVSRPTGLTYFFGTVFLLAFGARPGVGGAFAGSGKFAIRSAVAQCSNWRSAGRPSSSHSR